MRIAHISDFHFTHLTWNPLRLCSKRLLGHFNWIFRRDREFSVHQVDPLIDLFSHLGVDLVLLGGDFTTTALPEEFAMARAFVARLKQPWIAIPGNHDHYTRGSFREKRFYRYFANQCPKTLSLAEEGVEGHRIAPRGWVVALDTARPTSASSSAGLFTTVQQEHCEMLLRQIPADDWILMFNHYPFFQNDAPQRQLERGDALRAILARDPRIRLYLHGHTHRHTIADVQVSQLPVVVDSGSCSQGPQGAWNLIDLDDRGCSIFVYRWNQGWYLSKEKRCVWQRKAS